LPDAEAGRLGAKAPKQNQPEANVRSTFASVLARLATFKHRRGIRYDLADFLAACACLDNPERRLPPVIHVAGTNGKGSTVAYLATGFRAMGLRVGTYTSPHMQSYCERISDNDGPISESVFSELAQRVMVGLAPDLAEKITEFEVLTLMACLYFAVGSTGRQPFEEIKSLDDVERKQDLDIVIIETGLGGRLDATNVVTPIATVITPIGLDHQDILGDTLAKIAAEKAGIIKPNLPVFTAIQDPAAQEVLSAMAAKNNAFLHVISPWDTLPKSFVMQGDYQRQNAALAYAVIARFGSVSPPKNILSRQSRERKVTFKGLRPLDPVSPTVRKSALAPAMVWGRFTVLHMAGRRVIIDGAHNVHGLRGLQDSLRTHGVASPTVWMGVLKNRPLADMLTSWEGWASALWYTDFAPGTSHVFADVQALGLSLACKDVAMPETKVAFEAILSEIPEGGDWVITGSLYFLAGVYGALFLP
jgi:dihydrofolate synthase/folylpolyglutamate synthase